MLRSKTNQMCQKSQIEVKCKLVTKPSVMILLICRKQDAVSDGRGLTSGGDVNWVWWTDVDLGPGSVSGAKDCHEAP